MNEGENSQGEYVKLDVLSQSVELHSLMLPSVHRDIQKTRSKTHTHTHENTTHTSQKTGLSLFLIKLKNVVKILRECVL